MRRAVTSDRSVLRVVRRRGGTTLTEVLMSLLVMGIGVVSVATLFPLSVLRSVEATQQTTATALRYTAEALIDGSWSDPVADSTDEDMDGDVTEPKGNRRPGMPVAPAASMPLVGCRTAAIALDPDGDRDPATNDTNYVPASHSYGYDTTDHREGFYVVDPLGYWRLRQQAEPHDQARFFGYWGTATTGVGGPPVRPIPGGGTMTLNINRFSLNIPDSTRISSPTYPYLLALYGFTGTKESFGIEDSDDLEPPETVATELERNVKIAEFAVGLPDSFVTVADGRMSEGTVAVAPDSIDFSSGYDFSMFLKQPPDPAAGAPDEVMLERGQVTIFSTTGRRSIVRELETDITTTWTTAGADIPAGRLRFKTPLPASFLSAGVDRVLVEAIEDRYSWMLTVRRREPASLIDVVVFFRRAFGRQDERVYVVMPSIPAGKLAESKQYVVAWNSAAGDPRPEVDEGDWMFDPNEFRWHKIGQVVGEEGLTWNPAWNGQLGLPASYTADSQIIFRLEGNYVVGQDDRITRGIFMQGVVDVYPIEPKLPN